MKEYINNDVIFFENNSFFDSKIKKRIQQLANVEDFEKLIKWCSEMCFKKTKQIDYIGNEEYVKFFLFVIFRHKKIIKTMWDKCGSEFDKGFKKRFINNHAQFMSYLWELYLVYFLLQKGINVHRDRENKGPDIKVNYDNNIIWIECVSPKCGETNFKVPPIQFNGIFQLPLKEIKQRIKSVLLEKVKKYQEYIESKLVSNIERKYIAISTNDISQYGNLMDYSEPLLLIISKELNFFEENNEIDGLIYSHTSIFEYSNSIELMIIEKDYSTKRASCFI